MVEKINVVKGVQAIRLKNMRYLVRFPDLMSGGFNVGFSSITGLSFGEVEEIEYREGVDEMTPTKYPGQVTYPNVTMERGVALDAATEYMERWHGAVAQASQGAVDAASNGVERIAYLKTVEIQVLDKSGAIGRSLQLREAWLRNIALGDLQGDGNDIWISSFEIVHHGLVRGSSDWFSGIDPANVLPNVGV